MKMVYRLAFAGMFALGIYMGQRFTFTNIIVTTAIIGGSAIVGEFIYALRRSVEVCAKKNKVVVIPQNTITLNPTEQRIFENQNVGVRSFYNQEDEEM